MFLLMALLPKKPGSAQTLAFYSTWALLTSGICKAVPPSQAEKFVFQSHSLLIFSQTCAPQPLTANFLLEVFSTAAHFCFTGPGHVPPVMPLGEGPSTENVP